MYISPRVASIRNLLVSIFTGGITLIILLIAPLGLAAVIINTLLVTLATYGVSTIADRILAWLEPQGNAEVLSSSNPTPGNINPRSRQSSLNRWNRR